MRDDEGQSPLDITLGNLYEANDCMDVALYLMSLSCGGDEGKAKLLCGACQLDKLDVVKELVEQYKVEPKSEYDNVSIFSPRVAVLRHGYTAWRL